MRQAESVLDKVPKGDTSIIVGDSAYSYNKFIHNLSKRKNIVVITRMRANKAIYEKYEDKDLSIINQKRDDWNNLFEETISYRGKFNRMIYFDGKEWHASHINEDDCDRLVLITFFGQIALNGATTNYPIPAMRSFR